MDIQWKDLVRSIYNTFFIINNLFEEKMSSFTNIYQTNYANLKANKTRTLLNYICKRFSGIKLVVCYKFFVKI